MAGTESVSQEQQSSGTCNHAKFFKNTIETTAP